MSETNLPTAQDLIKLAVSEAEDAAAISSEDGDGDSAFLNACIAMSAAGIVAALDRLTEAVERQSRSRNVF